MGKRRSRLTLTGRRRQATFAVFLFLDGHHGCLSILRMAISSTMSLTMSFTLAKNPASERSELAGAEERWRELPLFRFGRRVCGRRSRTLSRCPGSCGAGRKRPARQRGGCGRQGASSPFGHRGGWASGECGVPQVRQHRITEHEQGGPAAG